MSAKADEGMKTGSVGFKATTIGDKVSRDNVDAEPINTVATSERNHVPITSALEMVATRNRRTELRSQLE